MAQKKAIVKQVQGITFVAKADSNHWVTMDGPEDFGGSNSGTRPKELLLIALGGCTGSDVAAILRKRKAPVISFEMNITGNESEEHPKVFTDIHVEYVFYGDGIDPKDIERAIEMSTTKYCSVSAMLKASVNISHSYRIEPAANKAK
ncbi:MAG: OsmC family protein [Ignavibacteriales bacterium]|nr:OsmC family protein [Ignavibacteriales bacterium]